MCERDGQTDGWMDGQPDRTTQIFLLDQYYVPKYCSNYKDKKCAMYIVHIQGIYNKTWSGQFTFFKYILEVVSMTSSSSSCESY